MYNPLLDDEESLAKRNAGLISTPQPDHQIPDDLVDVQLPIDGIPDDLVDVPIEPEMTTMPDIQPYDVGTLPTEQLNIPTQETPTGTLQAGQPSVGKFLKQTAVEEGAKTYGALENAVSMLVKGAVLEPAVGLVGLEQVIEAGLRGMEPDMAVDTMNRMREALTPYISPATPAGKRIEELVAKGAEELLGPISKFGREYVVEPAAKKAGEVAGPTGAGTVGAILASLPEMLEYIFSKKAGRPSITAGSKRARFTPTMTERGLFRMGAKNKASVFLREGMETTKKMAMESKWLQDKIKGLSLTTPSYFDEPVTKRTFETLRKNDPTVAKWMNAAERNNVQVLNDFLKNIKTKDDPMRIRTAIEAEKARLEYQLNRKKGTTSKFIQEARGGMQPEEAGIKAKGVISANEKAARNRASKLFDAVPDDLINAKGFMKEIKKITKPESLAENVRKNIPIEIRNALKGIRKKKGFISVKELYNIRKTWRRVLDDMYTDPKTNRFKERRMARAISALDEQLKNTILEPGKSAEALERARKYFLDEVVNKYETRTIQDLKKFRTEKSFVSDAEVGGKFFLKGNGGTEMARQYNRAIGDSPGGREAINAYIDDDFARSVVDPVTKEVSNARLKRWLEDYDQALTEYGLKDKYNTVSKAQDAVDEAQSMVNGFDKLHVSKVIDSDIDAEMDMILSSPTPRKDAIDLMLIIGDDKRAKAAAQNALIDRLEKMSKESRAEVDQINKFMDKNEGLFKTVFEGDEGKLKDLKAFRKALTKNFPKGELPDNWESMGRIMNNFFKDPWVSQNILSTLVTAAMRVVPDLGREKVKDIIRRSSIDPEFAHTIRKAGMDLKRDRPEMAERKLRRYIIRIGLPGTTSVLTRELRENEESR